MRPGVPPATAGGPTRRGAPADDAGSGEDERTLGLRVEAFRAARASALTRPCVGVVGRSCLPHMPLPGAAHSTRQHHHRGSAHVEGF